MDPGPLMRMGMQEKMTPERARALVEKVAEAYDYKPLFALKGADEATTQELIRLFEDPASSVRTQFVSALALSYTRSPLAVPVLLRHAGDGENQIRLAVAMSLPYFSDETGAIRTVLSRLAETDPWSYTDPKTGALRYSVRETARQGLERLAKAAPAEREYEKPGDGVNPPTIAPPGRVDVQKALAGKIVTLVNVGDIIRLQNTGPALAEVEFERYFPVVDAEQIVLGRWLAAYSQDRTPLPVSVTSVREDSLGNPIQTLKLSKVPANQSVVIIGNSLVARRERPMPQGKFSILPAEKYPAEVRAFLGPTATIQSELPEVRAIAEGLLAKSHDTLDVARGCARSCMRSRG
jgi:hypothetical protein